MAFGYTPGRAELVKTRIDQKLGKIEAHIRSLSEAVPLSGAITTKGEDAQDLLQEMAGDLHQLVDERTDQEAAV